MIYTPDNKFWHFEQINLKTQKGSSLTIFELSPRFSIKKILMATNFIIRPETKEIILNNITINNGKPLQKQKKSISITSPSFILAIENSMGTISYLQLLRNIFLSETTLFLTEQQKIILQFLQRTFYPFQIFIFIALTILLFLFLKSAKSPFLSHSYFYIYPVFLGLTTTMDFLSQCGLPPWTAMIPYLIILSFHSLIYKLYL